MKNETQNQLAEIETQAAPDFCKFDGLTAEQTAASNQALFDAIHAEVDPIIEARQRLWDTL